MRVTPDCDSINSFYINNSSGIQMYPDIAFGSSNYLATWSDRRGGTYYNIYAARVTPAGSVLEPNGVLLGSATTKNQYQPSVEYDGSRFLVVWGYATAPYAVTGRFVNTDGSVSDTFTVATATYMVYNTRIAFDGTNYLVVWLEYSASLKAIKGQLVAPDGSLVGSPFTIASNNNLYFNHSLGLYFDGMNYLVTYSNNSTGTYQVWGRKYDVFGSPLGGEFRISWGTNNCYYGDVVPGADNHYLNVWGQLIGGRNSDIYGNVDIEIMGIEEETKDIQTNHLNSTTIFTGPLHLPNNKKCIVYDISGRTVDANRLVPGVYFIEVDGKVVDKLIKVR